MDLVEAPLADMTVHGDDLTQDGSFSRKDRAYMRKAIEKKMYVRKLGKFPGDLFIYVLNAAGLDEFGEQLPEGELNANKLNHIKRAHPELSEFIDGFMKTLSDAMHKNPKGIHFVMGDNFSDGQMPPSPWIMIHRLVHAMFESAGQNNNFHVVNYAVMNVERILEKYNIKLEDVLTMSSAKTGKLIRSEATIEMATQYLITGDIPLHIISDQLDDRAINGINESLDRLKQGIDSIVSSCMGKAFYI